MLKLMCRKPTGGRKKVWIFSRTGYQLLYILYCYSWFCFQGDFCCMKISIWCSTRQPCWVAMGVSQRQKIKWLNGCDLLLCQWLQFESFSNSSGTCMTLYLQRLCTFTLVHLFHPYPTPPSLLFYTLG